MSVCVLDASFVFPWLFEDEASSEADAMLELVSQQGADIPSLWYTEIANGLGMAERRGRLSQAGLREAIGLLNGLHLALDASVSSHAFGKILDLMRDRRLTAYDATYLELALRRRLPLATNDKALQKAAFAAGVTLFEAKA
jgi:predicted nucleic acid-binding protein